MQIQKPVGLLTTGESLLWDKYIDVDTEPAVDVIVLLQRLLDLRQNVLYVTGLAQLDASPTPVREGLTEVNEETLTNLVPGERVSVHTVAKRMWCSRVAAHCRLRELAEKGLIERFEGGDALLPEAEEEPDEEEMVEETLWLSSHEVAALMGIDHHQMSKIALSVPARLLPDYSSTNAYRTKWRWQSHQVDEWISQVNSWLRSIPQRVTKEDRRRHILAVEEQLWLSKRRGVAEIAKAVELPVIHVKRALRSLLDTEAACIEGEDRGASGWVKA